MDLEKVKKNTAIFAFTRMEPIFKEDHKLYLLDKAKYRMWLRFGGIQTGVHPLTQSHNPFFKKGGPLNFN